MHFVQPERGIRILALFVLCLFSGCASNPFSFFSKKIQSGISTGPSTTKVDSTGPVEIAGQVDSLEQRTEIPMLPGQVVTISNGSTADRTPQGQASDPSVKPLVFSSHFVQARAPRNFSPPAPPSPSDLASGEGVKLFYWLAVGCAVGCVGMLYTQHYKAAGLLALASAGIPFLIRIGQTVFASHLAVGLIVAALTLVIAWELLKNGKAVSVHLSDVVAKSREEVDRLKSKLTLP